MSRLSPGLILTLCRLHGGRKGQDGRTAIVLRASDGFFGTLRRIGEVVSTSTDCLTRWLLALGSRGQLVQFCLPCSIQHTTTTLLFVHLGLVSGRNLCCVSSFVLRVSILLEQPQYTTHSLQYD